MRLISIKSIGRILDDEPVTNAWFARQLDCEGAGAFWALLAEEPDRYLARAKAEAIVLEFKSLPTHLQVQLGPRLALRLQSGGAEDLIPIALGRAEEDSTACLEQLGASVEAWKVFLSSLQTHRTGKLLGPSGLCLAIEGQQSCSHQ